jgi:hypothetical protein
VLWWWWWRRGGLSAHASVVTKQSLDFPFIFFLHDFFFYLGGMAIGILFFPMAPYWFFLDFLDKGNMLIVRRY